MAVYINRIVIGEEVKDEVNSLITNSSVRRRMTHCVKLSVAAAIKIIQEAGGVDAIITATSLGLLNDSEKFLKNIVVSGNELLNPTPFIQSTFNTVSGQIALLAKFHGYNMTYVQDRNSFSSALLDALMLLDEGKHKVLVGVFDEVTSIVSDTYRCLKGEGIEIGDRAVFFLLSDEAIDKDSLELESFDFISDRLSQKEVEEKYSANNYQLSYFEDDNYSISAIELAYSCRSVISSKKPVIVYNNIIGGISTLIKLKQV